MPNCPDLQDTLQAAVKSLKGSISRSLQAFGHGAGNLRLVSSGSSVMQLPIENPFMLQLELASQKSHLKQVEGCLPHGQKLEGVLLAKA